jgi:hypothetical protein
MIYRRSPHRPPRLLLRVVAGAGAIATIASAAACGSLSVPPEGVASMPEDAGDAGPDGTACLGLCDGDIGDTGGFFTDVTTPEGVVDAPPDGVADGSQEEAAAPADGGDQ